MEAHEHPPCKQMVCHRMFTLYLKYTLKKTRRTLFWWQRRCRRFFAKLNTNKLIFKKEIKQRSIVTGNKQFQPRRDKTHGLILRAVCPWRLATIVKKQLEKGNLLVNVTKLHRSYTSELKYFLSVFVYLELSDLLNLVLQVFYFLSW